MKINGVEVEICELDIKGEGSVLINFQGKKIPVNPLEAELEFYKKQPKKKDRLKLIEEKIKQLKKTDSFFQGKMFSNQSLTSIE